MGARIHIDEWIGRVLYRSDMTAAELMQKKVSWIWTVSVGIGVLVMTTLSLFLQVWVLVWYGAILLVYYAIYIPILARLRHFEHLHLYFLILVILTTFVAILKAGGLTYSLGLEFAGLACAMSSVLMRNARRIVIVFVVYAATILAAGLLQPYLTASPDVTPSVNLLYHIINILWLSGSTMQFTLDYMNQRSVLERQESLRLKELDEFKTRLYTNITHEFRTPLTVILGMADEIYHNTGEWLDKGLQLISHNGKKLLGLVNRMLDMQQIEAGIMNVNNVQANVIPFVQYLYDSFKPVSEARGIEFTIDAPVEEVTMDYDPGKLQTVIGNLVSNAIKYTDRGGRVTLKVMELDARKIPGKNGFPRPGSPAEKFIAISVEDNGIGIREEHLPHIFERFYKIESREMAQFAGSGIGLSLSCELVQLMNGALKVESTYGVGSVFTVYLPITRIAEIRDATYQLNNDIAVEEGLLDAPVEPFMEVNGVHDDKTPIVLVVEDHRDMTEYIIACLNQNYRVITAANGDLGYQSACDHIPDVVITDVMMPVMNGFELCRKLKGDVRTSHIPVIMLTARADHHSRIKGLGAGADAYLTKPFYKDELQLRVEKMIEQRRKLIERYRSLSDMPGTTDDSVRQEDRFMAEVRGLIEEHLADENFGVDQLARAIGMSRAQLYRKFEALTDIPVAKYIRKYRLHKALHFLSQNDLNVTETAIETGFRSVSHFSVAFKDEFGFSPSKIPSRDKFEKI